MARIRTVKPAFWSSPDTAACDDPWARLLFIAMWNFADDDGRGSANPKELAGFAFPNDEHIGPPEVRRMLDAVRRAFGVALYRVGGRVLYAIPSWPRHQKIDKRSATRWPGPEEGQPWDPNDPGNGVSPEAPAGPAHCSVGPAECPPSSGRVSGGTTESGHSHAPEQQEQHESADSPRDSAGPAEFPPSHRGDSGVGSRKRKQEVGTTTSADTSAKTLTTVMPDRFDEFWAAYPRKIKKEDARKAWRQVLARKVDPAAVVAAARVHAGRWQATGKDAEFIPYPASWLRGGSYADELEPVTLAAVPVRLESFEDFRDHAAGRDAARLIGRAYLPAPQPPSDPTPPRDWVRARALDWIDEHEIDIRDALAERRAG